MKTGGFVDLLENVIKKRFGYSIIEINRESIDRVYET